MHYLISNHNIKKYKFNYKISDNCHLSTDEKINYYHYKNEKIYLIGKIQGVYENKFLKNKNIKLEKFFYKKNIEKIKNCLEGQFLIIINKKNKTTIFQDKFSKLDIFYTTINNNFYFSNNFTDIIKFNDDLKINQYAIAHLLSSYSIRPAKKDTIFEKIKRMGVDEYISIEKSLKINTIKFNPIKYNNNYNDETLTEYFNLFIDYIKNTSKNKNKTIFMSSGFDSSFILGILTKIFNNKKIFGVTCLHYFNQRSGNYNKFEINRVKKLGKFYKIKNFFTKVNFKDDFQKMSEEISKISADKMIFNTIASFMHHRLSQLIKKKGLSKDVYAGEISDGAHNLGFSQLVSSTANENHGFREYADKKRVYLYSPTFLKKIYDNTYKNDFIFNEEINNLNYSPIIKRFKYKKDVINSVLSSLFLTIDRKILDKKISNIFNKKNYLKYLNYHQSKYFKLHMVNDFKNIYSLYLNLYNSFHWQGSTINTMYNFPSHNGLEMFLPFWGLQIQNFLSFMPENWGRGLELKPTKFPLKESFKKFLSYPKILEEGPHSYLYDVNEFKDPLNELIINSKTKTYILKIIKKYHPLDFISDELFNKNKIYSILKYYEKNNEKEIQQNSYTIYRLYCISKMFYDLKI